MSISKLFVLVLSFIVVVVQSCSNSQGSGTCKLKSACSTSQNVWVGTGQCPGASGSTNEQRCCIPTGGSSPSNDDSPPSSSDDDNGSDQASTSSCQLRVLKGMSNIKDKPTSGNSIVINKDFIPYAQMLNAAAKSAGVTLLITGHFRPYGYVVTGAKYPPAQNSPHKAGMALDVNVITSGGSLCNYDCLSNGNQRTFIRAATAMGISWGGDLRSPDYVHFYHTPANFDKSVQQMNANYGSCLSEAPVAGNFREEMEDPEIDALLDEARMDPQEEDVLNGDDNSPVDAVDAPSDTLSTGAIIGIVLGVFGFVVILIAVLIFFVTRVQRGNRADTTGQRSGRTSLGVSRNISINRSARTSRAASRSRAATMSRAI